MILFTDHGTDGGLSYWQKNIWLRVPIVWHNESSITKADSSGKIVLAPGAMAWHPGPNGEYSLIRFTVPSAGQYEINSYFYGADLNGVTTDVHILYDSVSFFDGNVTGFGEPTTGPVGFTVSLQAGDRIDFAVGYGNNRNFTSDSTGISAQIVLVPEPSISVLVGLSTVALVISRRRK
jgi:hypothetical protein